MSLLDVFHEKEVKTAKAMLTVTKQIETALQSNIAVDVFLLFPGGTELDKSAIALCEMAIKGVTALQAVIDTSGIFGRLKKLADDLTALHEDHDKSIGHYIKLVQTVYDDLFSKNAD